MIMLIITQEESIYYKLMKKFRGTWGWLFYYEASGEFERQC